VTRVLVAGVGNIFFGDDAFGVEVARQLAATPPADARVADFGIRAIHFAYELLEPIDLCVVADCMPRGGAPGTLYVVEPEAEELAGAVADAHAMNLPTVFAAVRELGGRLPRVLVVGCEPEAIDPGIGLSASVARAVPGAIEMIRDLVARAHEETP
jgi:hydrogenase maturation protease